MKLKMTPADFRVFEQLDFESDPKGRFFIHKLTKEKMTTPEALDRVGREAGVPRSAIAYAGLKDRQAITQQYLSIENESVDIRDRDLKVRFVGRSASKIDSKQSSGNRFQIVVRDLSLFDIARLRRNRAAVESSGLPNYFDDQRFGNLSQGQGFVFEALAKQDAELALRWLIATPPRDLRRGDAKLRSLLDRNWGDWDTCRSIARGPMYDGIFSSLQRSPNDFVSALEAVPTRLKVIHLFAYQSYLWNVAVSRWIRERDGGRDRLGLQSLCGPLTCWKYPNEAIAAALKKNFPLIDHATAFEDQRFGEIVHELLEERGLRQSDLRVRDVSGMRLQEEPRMLALVPSGLEVLGPWPDDEHDGRLKIELRFALPRGSYATLVVKRLFADPRQQRRESFEDGRERRHDRGRDRGRGYDRGSRERSYAGGGDSRRGDSRRGESRRGAGKWRGDDSRDRDRGGARGDRDRHRRDDSGARDRKRYGDRQERRDGRRDGYRDERRRDDRPRSRDGDWRGDRRERDGGRRRDGDGRRRDFKSGGGRSFGGGGDRGGGGRDARDSRDRRDSRDGRSRDFRSRDGRDRDRGRRHDERDERRHGRHDGRHEGRQHGRHHERQRDRQHDRRRDHRDGDRDERRQGKSWRSDGDARPKKKRPPFDSKPPRHGQPYGGTPSQSRETPPLKARPAPSMPAPESDAVRGKKSETKATKSDGSALPRRPKRRSSVIHRLRRSRVDRDVEQRKAGDGEQASS